MSDYRLLFPSLAERVLQRLSARHDTIRKKRRRRVSDNERAVIILADQYELKEHTLRNLLGEELATYRLAVRWDKREPKMRREGIQPLNARIADETQKYRPRF